MKSTPFTIYPVIQTASLVNGRKWGYNDSLKLSQNGQNIS